MQRHFKAWSSGGSVTVATTRLKVVCSENAANVEPRCGWYVQVRKEDEEEWKVEHGVWKHSHEVMSEVEWERTRGARTAEKAGEESTVRTRAVGVSPEKRVCRGPPKVEEQVGGTLVGTSNAGQQQASSAATKQLQAQVSFFARNLALGDDPNPRFAQEPDLYTSLSNYTTDNFLDFETHVAAQARRLGFSIHSPLTNYGEFYSIRCTVPTCR